MTLTPAQMANGLTLEHDYFFAARPENPETRESTSVWLYDDAGHFAFPRVGIEAEAHSWDDRGVQLNIAFADERILDGGCKGAGHSPLDAKGKPSILGAGPQAFQCIEPFAKWRMTFDGTAIDTTSADQIGNTMNREKSIPVKYDIELTKVVPAWVQDNSPEAVAKMSPEAAEDAAYMGVGWRYEQLFRAKGVFEYGGQKREFTGTGVHVKRQSVRPMAGFRGHCWQSAVFPDGRGFGYIVYPPREDGKTYNEAYVYQDGKMHMGKVVHIPWLRRIVREGDDVSVAIETDLGITKIAAVSKFNTFRVNNMFMPGFNLNQGGAYFTWDGQSAYGMMERSSPADQTVIG